MVDLDLYQNQSMKIISDASILEKSDFEVIDNLRSELQENFLITQMFRTRTEMEISVLDDLRHPTPDSKYWQAQREQSAHFSELVLLSYDYRKNLIEIKLLERKLNMTHDGLEAELIQIDIDRKNFISKNQERVAKDRIREIKNWHEIKENLKPEMKFSLVDVNEHQLISYGLEFVHQTAYISERISQDEKTNLLGKLFTTFRVSKEKGCYQKLIDSIPPIELDIIKKMGIEV